MQYGNLDLIKKMTEQDAENEQVKRFWNIYKELNFMDQQLFWEFVTGGTRIPDVERRWDKKMVIKVNDQMAAGSMPTSRPTHWELTLASSYEDEPQLKAKLLEAIAIGPGTEPDE